MSCRDTNLRKGTHTCFVITIKYANKVMITCFDLRTHPTTALMAKIQHLYDEPIDVIHMDETAIHPCIGCWDCWLKTPGRCVMKDDMEKAYQRYVNSDTIILLIDSAQGFINHRAKAFIDRSIPHYLPYIIIRGKECQHAKRYRKYADLVFHFDTEGLTSSEEQVIEDYLYRTAYQHKAKGYRLMGHDALQVKKLKHRKAKNKQLPQSLYQSDARLVIYNGSPRKTKSNSGTILKAVKAQLGDRVDIRDLKDQAQWTHWAQAFQNEAHVLFFMPLYVHAMPSHVMAFIERLSPSNGSLGFFIQSGFPESSQSYYLEAYFEQLTQRLGRSYGGTAIKGGMEGLQMRPLDAQAKMVQPLVLAIDHLATHKMFDNKQCRRLAIPVRFNMIVRLLFRLIFKKFVDGFWNSQLKANQAYEHALDRPYEEEIAT